MKRLLFLAILTLIAIAIVVSCKKDTSSSYSGSAVCDFTAFTDPRDGQTYKTV